MRTELMESIKSYKPSVSSVSQVRVLLIGPFGAGKSSFFNSINSVFRGHVTSQAMSGSSTTSLTTQVSSWHFMISTCADWFENVFPALSPSCDLPLFHFVRHSFAHSLWKLEEKESLCQSSCVIPWDWRKTQGLGLLLMTSATSLKVICQIDIRYIMLLHGAGYWIYELLIWL